MFTNKSCGRRALTIAIGITMLVLLLVGGANATKIINENATGGDCTSFGTWNATAKNCIMVNDLNEGIQIESDGVTLDGNGHTITNEALGVNLSGRRKVTIRNLIVKNFWRGIYLDSSDNNIMINNTVISEGWVNNWAGISLYNSSNNILSGNTANSNEWFGIELSLSSNNTLSGNNVSGNHVGIHLLLSINNTLNGNNALNNYNGIQLDQSSNNNTMKGNTANSNYYYGIVLSSSSNNTFSGNNVISNGIRGIDLDSYMFTSRNNLVYNNFFNNTENAFNDGTIIWNITRTLNTNIIGGSYLGGNFWANPNGTGFSQTCIDTDRDGICDLPFVIDANNIDYLPLAVPRAPPTGASGSISGYKINDTNGNGKWNADEKGISNWTIRLIGISGKGEDSKVIRKEILTDATGFYTFDNLSAGRYFVIENLKKGFVPTSSPVKRIKLAEDRNSMNNNFTNSPVHSRDEKEYKRGIDDYEAINRDIDEYKEDMN